MRSANEGSTILYTVCISRFIIISLMTFVHSTDPHWYPNVQLSRTPGYLVLIERRAQRRRDKSTMKGGEKKNFERSRKLLWMAVGKTARMARERGTNSMALRRSVDPRKAHPSRRGAHQRRTVHLALLPPQPQRQTRHRYSSTRIYHISPPYRTKQTS